MVINQKQKKKKMQISYLVGKITFRYFYRLFWKLHDLIWQSQVLLCFPPSLLVLRLVHALASTEEEKCFKCDSRDVLDLNEISRTCGRRVALELLCGMEKYQWKNKAFWGWCSPRRRTDYLRKFKKWHRKCLKYTT